MIDGAWIDRIDFRFVSCFVKRLVVDVVVVVVVVVVDVVDAAAAAVVVVGAFGGGPLQSADCVAVIDDVCITCEKKIYKYYILTTYYLQIIDKIQLLD